MLRTGLRRETVHRKIDQLLQNTDGNPYFLDQLLEGFDPASGDFRQIPLDEIVSGRLFAFAGDRIKTAGSYRSFGQPIRISELATVANVGGSALATLTRMRNERLVRLLEGGGEAMVETWHDKVRESVLDSLSPQRQKSLHLKLAEAIESNLDQRAGDWIKPFPNFSTPGSYEFPPSDRVLDLCQHYAAAEDRRAFVYQWLAGELAMRAYAVNEAHELFQQALGRLTPGESGKAAISFLDGIGRVCLWHKSTDQATEAFLKAVEHAPR